MIDSPSKEAIEAMLAQIADPEHRSFMRASIATMDHLGYTWHGGAQWKPPIGQRMVPRDDDEIAQVIEVQHKPRATRNLIPEMVYAREWEALASKRISCDDLDHDDPHVTVGQRIAAGQSVTIQVDQEHATLAATFVTWLGTSIGSCFLENGRRMESELAPRHVAGMGFLAAWTIHNARHIGVNSGWRSCEYMAFDGDWNNARRYYPPAMTAHHLEVIENVVRWLATSEATRFLARCEALIFAEQKGLSITDLDRLKAAMTTVEKNRE